MENQEKPKQAKGTTEPTICSLGDDKLPQQESSGKTKTQTHNMHTNTDKDAYLHLVEFSCKNMKGKSFHQIIFLICFPLELLCKEFLQHAFAGSVCCFCNQLHPSLF